MSLIFTLIYGSVREKRQGIRAVHFIEKQILQRGHQCQVIDTKKYPLPLLDKMYKEYPAAEAPETMRQIAGMLLASDAFVIVSGEYNHSIPPALKNLLDHFQREYFFKPSGITCYSAGIFGGVRAAVHLRAILCELGTPSIPSLFPIPQVGKNFTEEGDTENEMLVKSFDKFFGELVWYTEALKKAREAGTPY